MPVHPQGPGSSLCLVHLGSGHSLVCCPSWVCHFWPGPSSAGSFSCVWSILTGLDHLCAWFIPWVWLISVPGSSLWSIILCALFIPSGSGSILCAWSILQGLDHPVRGPSSGCGIIPCDLSILWVGSCSVPGPSQGWNHALCLVHFSGLDHFSCLVHSQGWIILCAWSILRAWIILCAWVHPRVWIILCAWFILLRGLGSFSVLGPSSGCGSFPVLVHPQAWIIL